MEEAATQGTSAVVGFALLAAVTLDGVPENLAADVCSSRYTSAAIEALFSAFNKLPTRELFS